MWSPHENKMTFMRAFFGGIGEQGKSIPGISLCSFSIGIIMQYVDVSLFPFNTVELNNLVCDNKCYSRLQLWIVLWIGWMKNIAVMTALGRNDHFVSNLGARAWHH